MINGLESYTCDAGIENESQIDQNLSGRSFSKWSTEALFRRQIAIDFSDYFRDLSGPRNRMNYSLNYANDIWKYDYTLRVGRPRAYIT